MNTSLIKSALAMTAAFAVGSALATETQIYGATFEQVKNEPINDQVYMPGSITNCHNNGAGWYAGSADDQSVVTANGGITNSQALKLQTEGGTLTNMFSNSVKTGINAARVAENTKVVFEAQVKFVASDTLECGVEAGGDAKFALYAYAPDGGSATNLVIFHKNGAGVVTNDVISNITIDCDDYQKVVVEYATNEEQDSYFSVKVGNDQATSLNAQAGADILIGDGVDAIWFGTVNDSSKDDITALCFKGTGEVDDIAIKSVEEAQQQADWDDPGDIPDGTSAGAQYSALDGTDLETADAKKLTAWATANNVDFSDVTDEPGDYVEAFLLNCEATAAAVAQEKAEFVLDITIVNGVPVISLPDGKTYNGTLQLKGSTDLKNWADITPEDTGDYSFFKYELSL